MTTTATRELAPPEPRFEGDVSVVWFRFRFLGGNFAYSYSAHRLENGQWCLSGALSPPSFDTWNSLWGWLRKNGVVTEMWVATSWQAVQVP